MKSMLHEASTTIQAIEQAWLSAGKPTDFTIKILDPGKKGFLWFAKRPAIVSIMYNPQKQTIVPKKSQTSKIKKNFSHQPKPSKHISDKRTQSSQASQQVDSFPKNSEQKQTLNVWTEETISFIEKELKEILKTINITTPYTTKADKKKLQITFKNKPIEQADDEKMFYSGLSYILMQLLKKKHKRKLRHFLLILTSTDYDNKKSRSPRS